MENKSPREVGTENYESGFMEIIKWFLLGHCNYYYYKTCVKDWMDGGGGTCINIEAEGIVEYLQYSFVGWLSPSTTTSCAC